MNLNKPWPADEATGSRLEKARARNAADQLKAEQAFAEAMQAYIAARERFADPLSGDLDGASVARVWLGHVDTVLGSPADQQ